MAESIDDMISERLEELSRTIFPVNYIFSKTYEFATKNRDIAITIATKGNTQVNFTKSVSVHPKMLEKQGFFSYRNRAYYVRELKIIDSYLILTPDELELPLKEDKERAFEIFRKAVVPYIKQIEAILRKRYATIIIRLPKREKPLILHRQNIKGRQTLTIDELFTELKLEPEMGNAIKEVLFRFKPALEPAKKKEVKSKPVIATFLTLEDGRIIVPEPGRIHAQEYLQLGEIPYHFEMVEGPIPDRKIITSFLQLENHSVARLLEEYSELAFLPFFLDIYKEQGGPPIRHVALLEGQLIIGRTPESTPTEGHFEIFIPKN